jgi:hypothetical protein
VIEHLLRETQQTLEFKAVASGKLLSKQFGQAKNIKNLEEVEFKIFSQWGDDGIIQYLITHLAPLEKSFLEFGVADYSESNTRFLLFNNNWSGVIFDSSRNNINKIRNSNYYWKYDLTARHVFATTENINQEILESGLSGPIGLLHIDIDGNDYWIWQALDVIDPVIVIMEYNSVFGERQALTIPYRPDFDRHRAHYSGLYFGASLSALYKLARDKGYVFVGSNSAGNNAYFVKQSHYKESFPNPTIGEGFIKSKFREARDENFQLTYVGGKNRANILKDLPLVNVETGLTEKFQPTQ